MVVALFSVLLAGLFLMQSGKVKDKQAQLENVKAELALLPVPGAQRSPATEQLAAQQKDRVIVLSAALQHRVAWDRVLREFALVLPDDVWLRELNGQSPIPPGTTATVPGPGTAPNGFVIQGYTYSHDAVARLLTRLSVMPDVKNVFLSRSTRSGRIVSFTISAEVRTPGATS